MQQLLAILITLDEMEAGRVGLDRSRADLNAMVIDVVERALKVTPERTFDASSVIAS